MTLSFARAFYGLGARVAMTGTGTDGTVPLGDMAANEISFSDANIAHSFKITGAGNGWAELDFATSAITTGGAAVPTITDGDGKDIEGIALPALATLYGVCVKGISGAVLIYQNGIAATNATLETSLTGANNDLVLTAVETGSAGNAITLALVNPSANSQSLSVTVTGNAISASLATDGSGTITTTANQLQSALEAESDVTDLVSIAAASGSDGSGVVTAMAATALSGGVSDSTGAVDAGGVFLQAFAAGTTSLGQYRFATLLAGAQATVTVIGKTA